MSIHFIIFLSTVHWRVIKVEKGKKRRQNSPQLLVKSATTLRAPFFFVASESRYLRMPPYSDTTEATDRDSTYSTNPVPGRKNDSR